MSLTTLVLLVPLYASASPNKVAIDYRLRFTLQHEASTSVAIYNERGELVRTLWSMMPTPAGVRQEEWDGLDDLGQPAQGDHFTFKLATTCSDSSCAVVGNSGQPTSTFGHVPVNFESVAVGPNDDVFSVHDWDEAHFDVIRWSASDGRAVASSRNAINGLCKAIAVDDDFVYVTSYETAASPSKSKFAISRLSLSPTLRRVDFIHAGRSIGIDEHSHDVATSLPVGDQPPAQSRLLALFTFGQKLYSTDSWADEVRIYEKNTGDVLGRFNVILPQALAVTPDGTIWVGHQHHLISAFDLQGHLMGTPIDDAQEIQSLTVDARGDLYLADRGAGCVKRYHVVGQRPSLVDTFGAQAQSGDRAPDRYYQLHGLAVDSAGNIITAQNETSFGGGRLAKFTSDGRTLWEQFGLEFQSVGTYSADDPTAFYSVMHHAYRLDFIKQSADYLGNTKTDQLRRGNALSGVPRIVSFGDKHFFFLPSGDGMQIFRIVQSAAKDRAPIFQLAAAINGNNPLPDGTIPSQPWLPRNHFLWSWHDAKNIHGKVINDVEFAQRPADGQQYWQRGPMDVDAAGDLWFVSYVRGTGSRERNAIYTIPCTGLDAFGNPIYHWTDATHVIGDEKGPCDRQKKMAVHDIRGLTYIYEFSRDYPKAAQNGGLHMGGNLLSCYSGQTQKWMLKLPEMSVGMDVAPGSSHNVPGGVLIGAEPFKGGIYYYSKDGLLLAKLFPSPAMGRKPNTPSGLLDMYGAIAANRNPDDDHLDVFAEDDFNDRILWYRLDDRFVQVIAGAVEPSSTQFPSSTTSSITNR